MKVDYSEILKKIRKYALAHYENGWDVIVEAYSDAELITLFDEDRVETYKEAKRTCINVISLYELGCSNAWVGEQY